MALTFQLGDSMQLYENDQLLQSLFDYDLDTQIWPVNGNSLGQFDLLDKNDKSEDIVGTIATNNATTKSKSKVKPKTSTIAKPAVKPRKEKQKRKSQCTKERELSKKRKQIKDSGSMLSQQAHGHIQRPLLQENIDDPKSMLFEDELPEFSEFFLNESLDTFVEKSKPHKPQTTEGATKLKTKKTTKGRKRQPRKPNIMGGTDLDDLDNKKRLKWSNDENYKLWRGIFLYGNNWTEVKREVTTRSYDQIKDKGRRLLFVEGWKTGRKKKSSDEAMDTAKAIAQRVLKTMSQN